MPTLSKPKIVLLVHPETAVRHSLALQLQLEGVSVTQVGSGREALGTLHRRQIDALVSAINLPDLDGWRLTRLVRNGHLSAAPSIPVVLVGDAVSEHLAGLLAIEYGVHAVLPLQRNQELSEVLRELLRSHDSRLPRQRLLVVEDYPETLRLIERILEPRFDLDLAEDGEQAVRLWQKGRYDLVLLDVMLPTLSGPEVMDRILAQDPEQAVIIMTPNSTLEFAEGLMLRGAVGMTTKPFRAEELRRQCEQAILLRDYWRITKELAGAAPINSEPQRETVAAPVANNECKAVSSLPAVGSYFQLIDGGRRRRAILAEFPGLSRVDVHELSGSTAKNQAAAAARLKRRGAIFAVLDGRNEVFLPFQFDATTGCPRPIMPDILRAFPTGVDGWDIAFWFCTPNAHLQGRRPVDCLAEASAEVLTAARAANAPLGH